MRKSFEFTVKSIKVKIINTWFSGAKLYVNGDLRDTDKTLLAIRNNTLLSASLGELGVLEIKPLSGLITVEMDAYLVNGTNIQHVYSSHKRLSLKEQRAAR
ncbi:hypothetical protein [Pseudoalteromonas sp. SR43-2]|uniref:hypothetical protein n=1 Tax=Pseudoalteromonas sp. SR43-2 TaxID=2760944 RepID=UPI0015F80D63|nr:hypothetical protein [Pseudoalteromonas sp. SR43-2]MBB1379138.1 hypothetical protein [Pseudoalteromonas sp. SR43-2]